jgi:hypothetical protein
MMMQSKQQTEKVQGFNNGYDDSVNEASTDLVVVFAGEIPVSVPISHPTHFLHHLIVMIDSSPNFQCTSIHIENVWNA